MATVATGNVTVNGLVRLDGTTGALDESYATSTDQYNGPTEFRVSPGGDLYMSGGYSSVNGMATFGRFTRLDADGNLDADFDPATIDNAVNQFSFRTDGSIILGGNFRDNPSSRLARLTPAGALDSDFNGTSVGLTPATSGNFRFPSVLTTLLAPDDSVYVGGYFDKYRTSPVLKMMRVSGEDGSRDTSFDPVFTSDTGRVWDMMFAGANILTVGNFHSVNSETHNGVALIDPMGDISTDLNVGTAAGTGSILDIAVGNNGDYYLSGIFSSFNEDTDLPAIVKLKTASGSVPHAVVQSPANVSAGAGRRVTFAVAATGSGALSFQWQKGTTDLPGETGPSLTLDNVMAANAGQYRVVVTAGGQSVNSDYATLTVAGAGGGETFLTWRNAIDWMGADQTPMGNPDNDRFNNFQEFVFGLNPLVADNLPEHRPRPVLLDIDGKKYPAVRFRRHRDRGGFQVVIEARDTLTAQTLQMTLEDQVNDLGNNVDEATLRSMQALDQLQSFFFLIKLLDTSEQTN